MKLVTASCAAMLAVAPATVAFAQDTQYPDWAAIAKTAGSAGQDDAAAQTKSSNAAAPITGRSVSAPKGASDAKPQLRDPKEPTRSADLGG